MEERAFEVCLSRQRYSCPSARLQHFHVLQVSRNSRAYLDQLRLRLAVGRHWESAPCRRQPDRSKNQLRSRQLLSVEPIACRGADQHRGAEKRSQAFDDLRRPEGNSSRIMAARNSGHPGNGVAKRREVTLSDSREHRRDDAVAARLMERERGWSGQAGAVEQVAAKRRFGSREPRLDGVL
jgi:hypothetical protein